MTISSGPSHRGARSVALASLALASLMTGSVSSFARTPPATVGAWTFDEGTATTAADSAGGKTATLMGDAGWATGLVGAHGVALSGKRGSYVDIPAPVIDTTQSYTVSAWVKLSRTNGYQTIVSIDGEQVSGFFLQLRSETGSFGLTVIPEDGPGNATVANATDPADPNVWYNVAGVFDATAKTLTLYVDGVAQETVPYTGAPWKATGHTAIGRGKYSGNPVDWLNGTVDDVKFYQAALTATDLAALVKPNLPPASATPVVTNPVLTIDAGQVTAHVSPMLYGLMTEEINYSYDGGLYSELIRNRAMQDNPTTPTHWSVVQDGGGAGAISLDRDKPLNAANPVSLRLDITGAGEKQRVGAANDGYWGIPVKPDTTYKATFYARASDAFKRPLTASLESPDGTTVLAQAMVKGVSRDWKQYSVTLKSGKDVVASAKNRFVISGAHAGTVWLDLVTLSPPTYRNRPNGNRPDLMDKMAAMKPAFLRLPGGNYLEGNTIAERFDWKKTIGPIETRSGHQGPWGYRSTDGMGLLEFLEWCEDLHMETVLAVYAGYSLRGDHVTPGADLKPFVQDALDEIEYATGDTDTVWGARRAADGHPKPFPVQYVEIGNEDWFDRAGTYDARYAQFHDAIKAKYPRLQLIATAAIKGRTPDLIDEHYYKSPRAFETDTHHYDSYSRTGPKIFVGEWASQSGKPTPNMNSALGDAAWMTGMERNSDVVVIESYAPMFVNVNPGGSQWGTNLIGYDGLTSYGSPSYYAQVMFGSKVGDSVLKIDIGDATQFYCSVTRDSRKGLIYLKVVNTARTARVATVNLNGVGSVDGEAAATTLAAASPQATNTITSPTAVVPVSSVVKGVGKTFPYTFPPYSVTVLEVKAR